MRLSTKLLSLALTTVLVGGLACISGCSQASTSSSGSGKGEAEGEDHPVTLQVFAANSLTKAMNEVQELYTSEHPEVTFADTQYEGSGTLVEMLGAGSYADILITASTGTMDSAVDRGYVVESSVFDLFTNELVMVTAESNKDEKAFESFELEDLASGEYRIAVGDASVPAGNYAKQSLSITLPPCWISSDGAVGPVSSGTDGTFVGTPLEGKVTEGSSVGNVCNYAKTGDVDIAFVYSSDVYRFGGVRIISVVPEETHKPILYPAALCSESEHAEEAEAFLDFCLNDERALQIWQAWGFSLAPQSQA